MSLPKNRLVQIPLSARTPVKNPDYAYWTQTDRKDTAALSYIIVIFSGMWHNSDTSKPFLTHVLVGPYYSHTTRQLWVSVSETNIYKMYALNRRLETGSNFCAVCHWIMETTRWYYAVAIVRIYRVTRLTVQRAGLRCLNLGEDATLATRRCRSRATATCPRRIAA